MGIGECSQPLVLDAGIVGEIELPQDTLDPDINGENLRAAIGEKEDAVGDFFADAPDADQVLARLFGWQRGDAFEGNFARGDLPRRDKKMARAKAKLAIAQPGFRREREARGVGEGMEAVTDFVAEGAAQLVVDLLDLDDLLERGANEIA